MFKLHCMAINSASSTTHQAFHPLLARCCCTTYGAAAAVPVAPVSCLHSKLPAAVLPEQWAHCSGFTRDVWLQGDPAWAEQAQAKDGQGLALTFTLWEQDCVVTVDELSKLLLPKMSKLYTVSTCNCSLLHCNSCTSARSALPCDQIDCSAGTPRKCPWLQVAACTACTVHLITVTNCQTSNATTT